MVDLYYKLPALKSYAVKIHLHCFTNARNEQPVLNDHCASVAYYPRFQGHKALSNTIPYMVSSRRNERLLDKLLEDDYPILMEGVHCTFLLQDKRFEGRKCHVRLHNAEFRYYHDLYRSSSSIIKKLFYWMESRLLKAYEKKIASKAMFWSVSEMDRKVYNIQLGCQQIEFLPLFIPDWEVRGTKGMGTYCLYHGDLSVDANEKAAIWLIQQIFNKLKIPLVIAGKNPTARLNKIAYSNEHTCLVANPSEKEMQDIIARAHINLMPSYTHTGIKIKLLNALFNGRHCVVNEATFHGSGLHSLCHMSSTAQSFCEIISQLFHQPFTQAEADRRKSIIEPIFNNEANAKKLVEGIWGKASL